MKTNLISFILAFFTFLLGNSQVITRTYNDGAGFGTPIYNVDVDLDGTDDYSFVNNTVESMSSWYCTYSYIRPLHSNALVGTFNSTSLLVKPFDDGVLIDDLAATYRYDADPNAFQIREQYLFGSSDPKYGYVAFKLNSKFGYFYTTHSSSYCYDPYVDAFISIGLSYARYENTPNTPITIDGNMSIEESILDQLNITTINNVLTISNISDSKTMDLIVTDIRGATLYTNTSASHTIDLNHFSSGVYIFQIHKEGQYHTFKKIVQ